MEYLPVPGSHRHTVAIPAPGRGPQQWAGAPSAVLLPDGGIVLAWRIRSGSDAVIISRSRDGESFETVTTIENRHLGSGMTERPSLIRLPDGRWRMYTSVAGADASHWQVGMIEAETLEALPGARHRIVFAGNDNAWVKDPVVRFDGSTWRAWICCHLRDSNDQWDGMASAYATSKDGIDWEWHGHVLEPRKGRWDARGARITTVFADGSIAYDGRRNAAENWFEKTGFAVPTGEGHVYESISDQPMSTARYLEALPLPGGGYRLFYEQVLPDESHELRTELVAARR